MSIEIRVSGRPNPEVVRFILESVLVWLANEQEKGQRSDRDPAQIQGTGLELCGARAVAAALVDGMERDGALLELG
jgi:hypothetical protein